MDGRKRRMQMDKKALLFYHAILAPQVHKQLV